MDVFGLTEARPYWRAAALQAAHALGVFEAAREPRSPRELAAALGLVERRLRALLDVLALEGFLLREGAGLVAPAELPEPPRPAVPPLGPGLLAQVIRSDVPLAEPVVTP